MRFVILENSARFLNNFSFKFKVHDDSVRKTNGLARLQVSHILRYSVFNCPRSRQLGSSFAKFAWYCFESSRVDNSSWLETEIVILLLCTQVSSGFDWSEEEQQSNKREHESDDESSDSEAETSAQVGRINSAIDVCLYIKKL